MKTKEKFDQFFQVEYLESIYSDSIVLSGAVGLDKVSQQNFKKKLEENLEVISRKVKTSTYRLTKYRLKLVSKGRDKLPRVISIPTVRDRVAIRGVHDFLKDTFNDLIESPLPQNIIRDMKSVIAAGSYDAFIKLDIEDFYPSIKHPELMKRIGRRVRDQDIKELVASIVSTPTVSESKKSDKSVSVGVPQGLSISNLLASVYLINIDNKYRSNSECIFYRYVDDILILCRSESVERIYNTVKSDFSRIGLSIHKLDNDEGKSKFGPLTDRFDYLGYVCRDGKITVRESSLRKLQNSIISIFTSYKHSDVQRERFLLWRLNLRITGCVFQRKSRGWMFFFSEIEDMSLLHSLDHFIGKMKSRFSVAIEPKRFVRSFYEIRHRKYESNYVPNFDTYTHKQKLDTLRDFFPRDYSRIQSLNLDSIQVDLIFRSRIDKQVKELLVDLGGLGFS